MKSVLVLVLVLVAVEARSGSYGRVSPSGKDPSPGEGGWGYGEDNGPNTWHDAFPTCGGNSQSPVSLISSEATPDFHLKPLQFHDYDDVPTSAVLTNSGHAVQVSMNVQASVSGGALTDEYIFEQFHFHWGATDTRGSEHTIDNVRFPAELHMVHYRQSYGSWEEALKHADGVAVLSIMLELSQTDNPYLHSIVNGLKEVSMPDESVYISPLALEDILPKNVEDYFSYQGSLTTPSCDEVVTWTVLKDTTPISSYQLSQFRQLTAMDGTALQDNFRTLQPLNGRQVSSPWLQKSHHHHHHHHTHPKRPFMYPDY